MDLVTECIDTKHDHYNTWGSSKREIIYLKNKSFDKIKTMIKYVVVITINYWHCCVC